MITQKEIADHLGVSRRLVGFALSGSGTVSQSTAQRIRETAQQLGYRPNSIARAMVTGKNPVLGFITWAPDDATVSRVLRGALEEVETNNYFLKVFQVQQRNIGEVGHPQTWDPSVDTCIDQCLDLRVGGVIATALTRETSQRLHDRLALYKIPVALVEVAKRSTWGIQVLSDDREGGTAAIEHLAELGHRRIGILAGPRDSVFSQDRVQVFQSAMRARGLDTPDELLSHAQWSAVDADAAAQTLLKAPGGAPTAIVCAADDMAMCVLRTARALGFAVPAQLSVIGCGNHQMAPFTDPPLSSIAQPYQEMGARAVERVLERLSPDWSADFDQKSEDLLPTRLVLRASTAPPRGAV